MPNRILVPSTREKIQQYQGRAVIREHRRTRYFAMRRSTPQTTAIAHTAVSGISSTLRVRTSISSERKGIAVSNTAAKTLHPAQSPIPICFIVVGWTASEHSGPLQPNIGYASNRQAHSHLRKVRGCIESDQILIIFASNFRGRRLDLLPSSLQLRHSHRHSPHRPSRPSQVEPPVPAP